MDPRKRRRVVGRIITFVVLLGALALIVIGFLPKPVPVTIGKVERQTLEVRVEEQGRTRVRARYVVSAPVTGQLERISLRAGDVVEANQVVAQISPAAPQLLDERTRAQASARVAVAQANLARMRAAIKRAETAQRFASDQAERTRKLHAGSGTSQQALEQAEYQRQSAEEEFASAELGAKVAANELDAARAALASISAGGGAALSVTAPVRGQVLRVLQESEGVVQTGMPLIELGDLQALEIVVDVLSTDAVRIPLGAEARIERWGGDAPLAARVRRKEPSAFTTRSALGVEEQRVPVVLELTDPAERFRTLGDGYRVEAHILVAKLEGANVVPASALFRDGSDFVTFAVRAEKAHKVPVQTGARTPDWVEVKGGLTAGDEVVLYPSDRVAEGVALSANHVQRRPK